MTDTMVYTDEKYAPPREIVQERIDQVMKGKIRIQDGPGASEYQAKLTKAQLRGDEPLPPPPSLCIMECAAYVLGWADLNDAPPCTSTVITTLMIQANDNLDNDRKRAALRALLPIIVNTAPYKYKPLKKGRGENSRIVYIAETMENDPTYQRIEKEREDLLKEWLMAMPKTWFKSYRGSSMKIWSPDEDHDDEDLRWDKITIPKFIEIVTALANLGHFAGHNAEQDAEEFKMIESGESIDIQEQRKEVLAPAPAIKEDQAPHTDVKGEVVEDNPGGIAGGVLDGTYDPGGSPQSQIKDDNDDN